MQSEENKAAATAASPGTEKVAANPQKAPSNQPAPSTTKKDADKLSVRLAM